MGTVPGQAWPSRFLEVRAGLLRLCRTPHLSGSPGAGARGWEGQGSVGLQDTGRGRLGPVPSRDRQRSGGLGGCCFRSTSSFKNRFCHPFPGFVSLEMPPAELLRLHGQKGPAAGDGSTGWSRARAGPGWAGRSQRPGSRSPGVSPPPADARSALIGVWEKQQPFSAVTSTQPQSAGLCG